MNGRSGVGDVRGSLIDLQVFELSVRRDGGRVGEPGRFDPVVGTAEGAPPTR